MSHDRHHFRNRLPMLATVVATVATLLSVRLVWLGAVADARGVLDDPVFELSASRGTLWDRTGGVIAAESFVYEVGANPQAIADPGAFADAVAPIIGRPRDEVRSLVDQPEARWALLTRNVTPPVAEALNALDLRGLFLTAAPRRLYPLGAAAAHLTGFVNLDGEAHYGLEAHYDALLTGAPGRIAGALGTEPEGFSEPQRGTDLVLTIDRDLQIAAAEALADSVDDQGAEGGTIIVLDPRTGDILAYVSLPTYDPADYGRSDPGAFLDPAISKQYEPGSVVKTMTMGAGLETGAVAPDSTYMDSGSTEFGGIFVTNWDQSIRGSISMTDLIRHSLNVGAVWVAARTGPEAFYRTLRDFGFGAPTEIDLSGEITGMLRDPAEDGWYEADLATNSFGQGMAATPIQVAAAMGAVANDGRLMVPRMVAARLPYGRGPEALAPRVQRQVVSPSTARQLRTMLRAVVDLYAVQADVPGYSVGGKTGTSQIPVEGGYDPEETIVSFVGFLPVAAPEVVILVKIDRPRHIRATDVAAPVFRRVAEAAVTILKIPPDESVSGGATQ